jgi:hypothetical protein
MAPRHNRSIALQSCKSLVGVEDLLNVRLKLGLHRRTISTTISMAPSDNRSVALQGSERVGAIEDLLHVRP